MNNEYRIELLEEAQEMLRQVILIVQSAVLHTEHYNYYDAYVIRNLRNMIDGGVNPREANLDSIIKSIIGDEKIIQDS